MSESQKPQLNERAAPRNKTYLYHCHHGDAVICLFYNYGRVCLQQKTAYSAAGKPNQRKRVSKPVAAERIRTSESDSSRKRAYFTGHA